jgi:hypothetical protein
MIRLKKQLTVIVLSGLIAISGCGGFSIGWFEPSDRTKSVYKDYYSKKKQLEWK